MNKSDRSSKIKILSNDLGFLVWIFRTNPELWSLIGWTHPLFRFFLKNNECLGNSVLFAGVCRPFLAIFWPWAWPNPPGGHHFGHNFAFVRSSKTKMETFFVVPCSFCSPDILCPSVFVPNRCFLARGGGHRRSPNSLGQKALWPDEKCLLKIIWAQNWTP